MCDGKLEQAALGTQNRASFEKSGDRSGVERRRHHDDQQIRPPGALQTTQQRQRKIGFQMPLVKLVQHHGIDAGEQRIRDQTARENAFGEESKPGSRARHFFEANLIADGFAQLFPQFLRYAARGQSRGQPARLQHQDLAADHVEQSGRNARGFSGAGRRLDH